MYLINARIGHNHTDNSIYNIFKLKFFNNDSYVVCRFNYDWNIDYNKSVKYTLWTNIIDNRIHDYNYLKQHTLIYWGNKMNDIVKILKHLNPDE